MRGPVKNTICSGATEINRWMPKNDTSGISYSFKFQMGETESTFCFGHYLTFMTTAVDDECGAVNGITTGRGNQSTRNDHVPALIPPLQILDSLNLARTRAIAFCNRQITDHLSCGTASRVFVPFGST
jgi:hypothetical protein